jgi:DUF2075 family protein
MTHVPLQLGQLVVHCHWDTTCSLICNVERESVETVTLSGSVYVLQGLQILYKGSLVCDNISPLSTVLCTVSEQWLVC